MEQALQEPWPHSRILPGRRQEEFAMWPCDPGGLLQNRETGQSRKWLERVLGRVLRKFGVLEGVLAKVLLLIPCQGKTPRSTLASTPASTPNFSSILPSTFPSHFLDCPVSLFCSKPPGSQMWPPFCCSRKTADVDICYETIRPSTFMFYEVARVSAL